MGLDVLISFAGLVKDVEHTEIYLPNDSTTGPSAAIMDIPIYKSRVNSLHVLFTLYSEFRNSVHFRRLAEDNYLDAETQQQGDRLVID